jgi:hypothetical protein
MDGIHIVRQGDLPLISKGKWYPRLSPHPKGVHYPNPKLPPIIPRKAVSDYSLSNIVKAICQTSTFFFYPYPEEGSSIQEITLRVFPPNL